MKQSELKSWFLLRLFVFAAAPLLTALPVSAQADAVLAPIGGNGGGQFVARCNDGQYLTGFQLRTGDDVDAIRPICVPIKGPSEVGPRSTSPNYFGGNGGAERELVCPGDTPIVTGVGIGYEGEDTVIVNNIHLYCGLAVTNQKPPEFASAVFDGPRVHLPTGPFGRFGGELSIQIQRCPPGYLALGINGRSGIWLDAVGLICGVPKLPPNPSGTSPANVPPPVGSIGRVTLERTAFIYAVANDNAGSLQWFRHDGAGAGKFNWQVPRVVNTGWSDFKLVFPGGDGMIYAITRSDTLMLYQHTGFINGLGRDDPKGWLPAQQIATGWSNVTQAFSGGSGIIYTIATDGKLRWYRLISLVNGKFILDGPKEVGHGWGDVRKVFSIGDGIIYAVTNDGKLRWFQHKGYLTGDGLGIPDAWIGPKEVGSGWGIYRQVFGTANGFIYGIAADGKLMWYHHRGFKDGRMVWDGPEQVGTGWGELLQVFAQP